jgi:hypothetical protein
MPRQTTYQKIYRIESSFGSLVNALEASQINYSTYYRWRKIILSQEYVEFVKENYYK